MEIVMCTKLDNLPILLTQCKPKNEISSPCPCCGKPVSIHHTGAPCI